jgi:hypothetical protein
VDPHDRAWAAGFFDGEGWANAVSQRSRRTRQPQAQINQGGLGGPPEVLLRFQDIVGVGRVSLADAKTNLYRWTVSSRSGVTATYEALRPWLGGVKHAQLVHALGIPAGGPFVRFDSGDESTHVAWAAGLFDGEGSVYLLRHRTHAGYFVVEAAVTQSGFKLPQVLARFQEVAGFGSVGGPYDQEKATMPVYRWKACRRIQVEDLVSRLWPWLGAVKRIQATTALAVVRAQAPLRRGNPAWGCHKTHCVHGHEYASARVRSFVPRRGGLQRRDSKQCLQCLREYAAGKRAADRAASDK